MADQGPTHNLRLFFALLLWAGVLAWLTPGASNAQTTVTFNLTGSEQQWVVPTGVTSIQVTAKGAKGGDGNSTTIPNSLGGQGGTVNATLAVTPGTALYLYVGGQGKAGQLASSFAGAARAFNGGGLTDSYNGDGTGSGGGGGATDIRIGGNSLSNRVLVAGGGGGGVPFSNRAGGAGGGTTGGAAQGGTRAGQGATQSEGGAGNKSGSLGIGGDAWASSSGGGGGGYYGGGAGDFDLDDNQSPEFGGGGGSSYTDPTLCTNVVHTQGNNNGDGSITISWGDPKAVVCISSSAPNISGTFEETTLPAYTRALQNTDLNALLALVPPDHPLPRKWYIFDEESNIIFSNPSTDLAIPLTGWVATNGTPTLTITTGACSACNPVTPSVSITANPGNSITTGTSVTFTATPVNGGTAPTYQWKKNNTNVGSNSATYTDAALANGDKITCVLTSSDACASPATATSNEITMTVNTPSTNGPVCTAYTTYTTANGLSSDFFGRINSIFVDGSNIYACLANSLDISTNGGTSFTQKVPENSGLASIEVNGVYASGSKVFAATREGLSQSTNGGATFTTNISLGNVIANCIAVSGSNVYVGTQSGVAISTDGGVNFTTTSLSSSIMCIAVSGTTVLAGSNNGIYISTNGGSSFIQKTMADGLKSNRVNSVAIVGGTMYVAMRESYQQFNIIQGGVDIITNNGATITHKTTADGLGSNDLNGIQVIGTTVYAATRGGLSISTNGGNSFTNYTTSNTTGLASNLVRTVYVTSSKIYAGTNLGLSVCGTVTTCTPSVSIAANPTGSITAGTSVTFTATPTNGGTTPTYVWKKNNITISGEMGATYTTTTLAHGDKIKVEMTSNAACASPTTATSNEITMAVCTPPTAFNITGGGSYCAGGSGVAIELANSESGVSYQLKKDNVDDGSPVNGTGSAISFGNKTVVGTYTVVATRTTGNCTATMTGSVTISITALPTAYTVTGGGAYCAGGSGVAVGLSNSESGVSYQLKKDNVNAGTPVAGTGAAISFGNQTAAGNYTVEASKPVSGSGANGTLSVPAANCTITMTGSVAVTINTLPTAAISGTAQVCKDAPAPPVTFTGSAGKAPYTFTYTLNSGSNQTLTTTEGSSVSVSAPTVSGGIFSYALVSVSDANNCTQIQLGNATVDVLDPAVPANPKGDTLYAGQAKTLTAAGCTGEGFTLLWFNAADNSPVSMPVSPAVTTNYYAKCRQILGSATCFSAPSAGVTVLVRQRIFVNTANTNSTQNGTAWATAFASLQAGLSAAKASSYTPLEVWVAQGTYTPGTLRKDVFTIPSGVKIYGGFVGNEDQLTSRDWKARKTLLSGEIGTAQRSDNTYHVVFFSGTNDQTRLDGFHIEKAFGDFFTGNQSTNLNNPDIQQSGGGILVTAKSKGTVSNCIITDNKATFGGGMFLRDSSHLLIAQTIIWGNEATFGGGVYIQGGSKPRFENVLIVSNKGLGGGLYVNASQPTLIHCTVASNLGTNGTAGGIFNTNAVTTLKNSIVWGNSAPQSTNGSTATYSIVEGGSTGTGNLSKNPLFMSPTPSNLAPLTALGDYHLQPCSPAIDAANNADALPPIDLDGNPRPFPSAAGIVDMGAYESSGTAGSGPATLTLTDPITSGTVLKTAGRITATNQVSGATIVYQGSQSVTLLPGFSANRTTFQAIIGNCGTSAVTVSEAQK
ncbi:hypothetical protein Runsl_3282 [Runella slithyformis DSM 19594]|uniref:receptor protein-tyrosine kinase n=2 Tax=Runella TaxID=105 RepID=A0A7U3ZM11_RUNSL|nr:hypothetical protein Runsl_3282 [Runella slithyformis DSM 19594]